MITNEDANKTYVGITNDLKKRIRQHSGELVGGAKSTSGKGLWHYVCVISGFPTDTLARQFEWALHHCKPRRYGVIGRIKSLQELLAKAKWTSKADRVDPSLLKVTWHENSYQVELHPSILVENSSINE